MFLKYTACSRCELESSSTDFLNSGIASTMADDNTVLNAKQVLANGVLTSVVSHTIAGTCFALFRCRSERGLRGHQLPPW